MLEIEFLSPKVRYKVTTFRKISDHIVAVNCLEQNTSGFKTYIDGVLSGSFTSYTTIYRVTADLVYYSNDGSIYVEPTTEIKVTFDSTADVPEYVAAVLSNEDAIKLENPTFTKTVKGDHLGITKLVIEDEAVASKWHDPEIDGNVGFYKHKTDKEIIQEEIDKCQAYLDFTDKVANHMEDIRSNAKFGESKSEEEVNALQDEYYQSKKDIYLEREAMRNRIIELRKQLGE